MEKMNVEAQLKRMWKDIFGDSEEYIDMLFKAYLKPQTCRYITDGDKVTSSMLTIDYTFLSVSDIQQVPKKDANRNNTDIAAKSTKEESEDITIANGERTSTAAENTSMVASIDTPIATAENTIIGYVENSALEASHKCNRKHGFSRDKTSMRGLYLCGLMTMPEYRGKGFIRRLMADAEYDAYCAGYDFLFLIPADDNLRRFYANLGYANMSEIYDVSVESVLALSVKYDDSNAAYSMPLTTYSISSIYTLDEENLRKTADEIAFFERRNYSSSVMKMTDKFVDSNMGYAVLIHNDKDWHAILEDKFRDDWSLHIARDIEERICGVWFACFDSEKNTRKCFVAAADGEEVIRKITDFCVENCEEGARLSITTLWRKDAELINQILREQYSKKSKIESRKYGMIKKISAESKGSENRIFENNLPSPCKNQKMKSGEINGILPENFVISLMLD